MIINSEEFLDPPPSYQEHAHMCESDEDVSKEPSRANEKALEYGVYDSSGKGLKSSANISKDGRINICMHLHEKLPDLPAGYAIPVREFAVDPNLAATTSGERGERVPRMSIVIMIVGSRGDVQPFLALGQELLKHGHRVRIATHGTFRSFVKDAGLEFYDIGGNPQELMSYMVKNPGLMPGWASLTNGDIPRKQKMLSEILDGCWSACTQPDIDQRPFIADAIISNPPAFAHIHCAEALGIPLQLSFTMPWSPTTAFPHPLVNISQSNAEPGLTNYLSYGLAEMMTWQGLGGVINKFRTKRLGLKELNVRSGPGVVDRVKIPWTFCFSPELIPKPEDWQNHIDVVGFYFLNLASGYTPPADLASFLQSGPPPIYIGFGSVVVNDPQAMTDVIFKATEKAGVRALVSAGWGGLGNTEVPPHIFILGNVPHDWLFTQVFAVCHHGGAGTTAIGLQLGKPTIIVPFFGDQPFWGAMVHKSGAGPKPIRKEKLDVDRLARSIQYCKTREAREAAEELGRKIRAQNGVENGVNSFYQHLPVLNMRCDLLPDELAVWWSAEHCLKLSAVAAQVLNEEKLINIHKLEIHRPKEYDTRTRTYDPVTGGVVEALRTITTFSGSIAQIFTEPTKGLINTTTAIPRSIWYIMDSIAEGFNATPALYGSTVRKPGRLNGIKSGMKEGGKAFFFGISDGLTGLWTEPVSGYKSSGWKGLAGGISRSYANLLVRPAAGSLSLFTYPVRGALVSLNRQDNGMEKHVRQLRVDQGREATGGEPDVASSPTISPSPTVSFSPTISPSVDSASVEESTVDDNSKGLFKKKSRRIRREEGFERYLRSLRAAPAEKMASADCNLRERIVLAFMTANQKDNLKGRKKALQKRIQWVITKGGVGNVTQVTKNEERYFAGGQITTGQRENIPPTVPPKDYPSPTSTFSAGPLSPLPPRRSSASITQHDQRSTTEASRTEWTEEDEALFSKQLEEATRLSLQMADVKIVNSPSASTSAQSEHDADVSTAAGMEDSTSQVAPDYRRQLLEAAAIWTNQAHDEVTVDPKGRGTQLGV